MLWLLALQVPLYAVNAQVAAGRWAALDVGGSITIHAFGAVYGLAASYWLSPPGQGAGHPKAAASYTSDVTAMLGTLVLWLYWPSFNGALAGDAQLFCIINTLLALLGATLAAVAASVAAGGKLDMVHVQNATLAGGVAIGSSANLHLPPAAALAGVSGERGGALNSLVAHSAHPRAPTPSHPPPPPPHPPHTQWASWRARCPRAGMSCWPR